MSFIDTILRDLAEVVHNGIPDLQNEQHLRQLVQVMVNRNIPDTVIYEVFENLTKINSGLLVEKGEKFYAKNTKTGQLIDFDSEENRDAAVADTSKGYEKAEKGDEEPKDDGEKLDKTDFLRPDEKEKIDQNTQDSKKKLDNTIDSLNSSSPETKDSSTTSKIVPGGPAKTYSVPKDTTEHIKPKTTVDTTKQDLSYMTTAGYTIEDVKNQQGRSYNGKNFVVQDGTFPPNVTEVLKGKIPFKYIKGIENALSCEKKGNAPKITTLMPEAGAGEISAQIGELAYMLTYNFPFDAEGEKAFNDYILHLEQMCKNIESMGKKCVLDESWFKHLRPQRESFKKDMDRRFGNDWEIISGVWDIKGDVEGRGINYEDKTDSMDQALQIKVIQDGKETIINEEVSNKKDWKIYFLNAGLGEAKNFGYLLNDVNKEKEYKDIIDKKLRKEPLTSQENAKYAAYNKEIIAAGVPVDNKSLQRKQMESVKEGIKNIPTKITDKMIQKAQDEKVTTGKGVVKNVYSEIEIHEMEVLAKIHNEIGITNKEQFMEAVKLQIPKYSGDKYYKKAVMNLNKLMSSNNVSNAEKWLVSHTDISKQFIIEATQTIANDSKFRNSLVAKLKNELPIQGMVEGRETLQIDGLYLSKDHMTHMFGTDNWNDIKEHISISIDKSGQSNLTYSLGDKNIIKIGSIGIREKGIGYDGNPSLLVEPHKEFRLAAEDAAASIL